GYFSAAAAAAAASGNDLKAITGAVKAATGRKGAELYMPLRVALTGRAHGPEHAPLLKAMPPGKARERLARFARGIKIRIHKWMRGEEGPLQPITPGQVRMYVCGMTVYDYIHIGHARMLSVFDMVSRYLRYRGLKLTYVRN